MGSEPVLPLLQRILTDVDVLTALRQAWIESEPGFSGGHEEGGFIIQNAAGDLWVLRWPRGQQRQIMVPSHAGCKIQEEDIVATFHTHPNTGVFFLQEPSETDVRAVRDDPDLKGNHYVGELVISQRALYRITPTGDVVIVGDTTTFFEGDVI